VRSFHVALALGAALLAALSPTGARADGAVLGTPAAKVHVAVAAGTDRTTKWVALTAATQDAFVWVLPIARGSAVDVVDPAWLEALDFVSAPRIASTCGGSDLELVTQVEVGRPSTASAGVAHDLAELDALSSPTPVDGEVRAQLAARLAAEDLLVLRSAGKQTATVRVVEPGTLPRVSLSLLGRARPVDVTLFAIGAGRATTGRDLAAPGALHWFAGTSDYLVQRDVALAKADGAFVVESASATSVFASTPLSPYAVPSLAERYFGLAAQRGLATGAVPSCVTAAQTLAPISTPLLPACAPAKTAGAPLLPCGTTATARLTCGSRADDLALALSGQAPSAAWITRFAGRVSAGSAPADVTVTFGAEAKEAPLLRVAAGRCAGSGVGSGGGGGAGGGSADPLPEASSGGGCGGGTVTVVDGESEDSEGCGGSSAPSDSGADDCDSGGDSSSSSGDDCDSGGDSSSSSGDDCDSDSSSGGDDCDSAAPKRRASRGTRSPVSRAVLGLAFLALPLRRLARRRQR
jgi:hypothetical protein